MDMLFALFNLIYFLLGYLLLHRYSFNDGTASDSVGGTAYTGTLIGGATVNNMQAMIATSAQKIFFPAGLLGSYKAISVETWVTTAASQAAWATLFQFGPSASINDVNTFYVNMCSGSACNWNKFNLGWVESFYQNHRLSSTAVQFGGQTNMHVVYTVKQDDYARLYLNGALAATSSSIFSPLPPVNLFYLGCGSCDNFVGSVNELRMWGMLLSAADISLRYSQGPSK